MAERGSQGLVEKGLSTSLRILGIVIVTGAIFYAGNWALGEGSELLNKVIPSGA